MNQPAESNPLNATSPISTEVVDHGSLPAWERADLPEPLPFGLVNLFKTIGPGAILLAAAIGGGEWIVGPLFTIKYGRGILWIATVGIVLQTIFNLEAARYTMYTGEPIITGLACAKLSHPSRRSQLVPFHERVRFALQQKQKTPAALATGASGPNELLGSISSRR